MNTQFALLLFLTVAVNTGMGIIIPVLPNMLKDFGFTTAALSLPFLVLVLARVIIKPYAGKALQRFSSRQLLAFSFGLYALVFLIYPLLSSPESFVIIRFLEGVVEGIAGVVLIDVAIAMTANVTNRGVLMGYFSSAFGLGFIVGPLLGSFSYAQFGANGMFLLGAFIGLLGLAGSFALASQAKHKPNPASSFMDTVRGVLKQMRLFPYYSPSLLRRALFFSFMMVLPLHVHEALGLSFTAVGWYFTASAVITTTLMPLTGRLADRLKPGRVLAISLLSMGVLIGSFGMTDDVYFFTALFLLETVAFAVMLPAGMTFFADLVQEHPERGAVLGNFGSLTEASTIILALTVLPAYALSPVATWIGLGLLCLLAAIPFLSKLDPQAVGEPWQLKEMSTETESAS